MGFFNGLALFWPNPIKTRYQATRYNIRKFKKPHEIQFRKNYLTPLPDFSTLLLCSILKFYTTWKVNFCIIFSLISVKDQPVSLVTVRMEKKCANLFLTLKFQCRNYEGSSYFYTTKTKFLVFCHHVKNYILLSLKDILT